VPESPPQAARVSIADRTMKRFKQFLLGRKGPS
jgi:hypothetical protein